MPQFIISADTLKKALSKLSQAINKKSVLPIVTNVLCRVRTNNVELIATDLELTIQYECECETKSTFDILIPFDFINKVVGFNKGCPVKFELLDKVLKITGSNDVYDLRHLDNAEEFPKMPALPEKNMIALNGSFIYWLNAAMATVSDDELRPQLTKICLEIEKERVILASTDAHRLFTHSFPAESIVDDQLLIAPKIAKALDGFDKTEIYWHKNHIAFKSDNITVIATRPEGKFADYRAVIPSIETNLSLNREALIDALEKCSLTSSPSRDTVIRLKNEDAATVRLTAQDNDFEREISVDIVGSYKGDVEAIAVNASKMISMLNQVSFENIELSIDAPNKAILLRSEGDPDYLALLMPLSMND